MSTNSAANRSRSALTPLKAIAKSIPELSRNFRIPMSFFLGVMRSDVADPKLRPEAGKAAATYLYKKPTESAPGEAARLIEAAAGLPPIGPMRMKRDGGLNTVAACKSADPRDPFLGCRFGRGSRLCRKLEHCCFLIFKQVS
jgi:hypothetical protein